MTTAYKGFFRDMTCRDADHPFDVGKTYERTPGYTAFETLRAMFRLYPPAISRFARVTVSGDVNRGSADGGLVASRIFIEAEVDLAELLSGVADAVKMSSDVRVPITQHDRSGAITICFRGAAFAPTERSVAAVTGYGSAAVATGNRSAAICRSYSCLAITTGCNSAATAAGRENMAVVTGGGSRALAIGPHAIAMASGAGSAVSGIEGSALFLVERGDEGEIVSVWAGIVGQDGVAPNAMYRLRDGEVVEVAR